MIENRSANSQESWEAIAEVWTRYRARFYQTAFRQLGSREDTEDALQDALLRALKGVRGFRGESHLSTWLYTIVTNSARSFLRQQSRREVLALDQHCDDEENLRWVDLLVDSGPGQEDIYASTELSETLENLMQQLPAAQSEVCRLRALNGFSMQEISECLGIPEGTVKAQLSRGRAELERLLHQVPWRPQVFRKQLCHSRRSAGQKRASSHLKMPKV